MATQAWILAVALGATACGGTGAQGTSTRSQDEATRGSRVESTREGQSTSREADTGGKGRAGEHHVHKN